MGSYLYIDTSSLTPFNVTETVGSVSVQSDGDGSYIRALKGVGEASGDTQCGVMYASPLSLSVGDIIYFQTRQDTGGTGSNRTRISDDAGLITPATNDVSFVFTNDFTGRLYLREHTSQGSGNAIFTNLGSNWVDWRIEVITGGQFAVDARLSTGIGINFDPATGNSWTAFSDTTLIADMTSGNRYIGMSTTYAERYSDIREIHITDDGNISRDAASSGVDNLNGQSVKMIKSGQS